MGITAGICAVAFIGSWYGFWATKKIISFTNLEKETKEQQEPLRESLDQTNELRRELNELNGTVDELMKSLNPRSVSSSEQSNNSDLKEVAISSEKVSALRNGLANADDRLKMLQAQMAPVIEKWHHTPSLYPTVGTMTSPFGGRIHPFTRGTGGGDDSLFYSHHSGIDFSNAIGTPIQATANGEVTYVDSNGHYGLMIIIRHSEEFETAYAHLNRSYVVVGQKIERGHIIGAMGRTGRATGPHLHYEVRRYGQAVNPKPYLNLQRQWLTGLNDRNKK
jgi:murein DD-endopeptidase MepM/ murein hydrolase activator NlpD